ncbi:hypothetical protein FACS189481_1740 [Clostridia bacterium]|nr:hypothetical protein FACS189481_1740 [Clostridia bacterium]
MATGKSEEATQTTQTNSSQSQPAAPSLQTMLFGGPNGFMLIVLLICCVFVWFSGKGKKKREQEEIAIRKDLEIGDELTTIGGIVGIVVAVKDDVFTLETGSDRSKLRIEKWAIKSNVTAATRMAKQKEIEKNKQKGRPVK